jgi:hypothetical protein
LARCGDLGFISASRRGQGFGLPGALSLVGAGLADDLVAERLAHEHGEQLAGLHGWEVGHGSLDAWTAWRAEPHVQPGSSHARRLAAQDQPADVAAL